MKVKRWDWDRQGFVEDEYPDTLFQPLIEWLLTTKAWIEDVSRVNRKVIALERSMAEYRQPAATHREDIEPGMEPTPAPTPAEVLAEKRRANLAKARVAKRTKREVALAEG